MAPAVSSLSKSSRPRWLCCSAVTLGGAARLEAPISTWGGGRGDHAGACGAACEAVSSASFNLDWIRLATAVRGFT